MKKVITIISLCFLVVLSSCSNKQNENFLEKTVAVEANSLSADAAKVIKSEVKSIEEFSTSDAAVSAVESRELDFVVLDEFETAQYIENKRKLKVVKTLDFTTDFCAYFYKNTDLQRDFNRIVLDLIEDGTIEQIKNSYKSGEAYYPVLTKLSGEVPTMTIAVEIAGAPYSDLTDDGAVVGIDIDVATLVANKLGYNLEIMVVPIDEAFMLLEEQEVDFVISGLVYESTREEDYDSSFSYLSTQYYLLSRG